MLSGPHHEASEASDAIPEVFENERAAPRLRASNRSALPRCPAIRARRTGCADGAMVLSQDEIDGTAPASSALRRRLKC